MVDCTVADEAHSTRQAQRLVSDLGLQCQSFTAERGKVKLRLELSSIGSGMSKGCYLPAVLARLGRICRAFEELYAYLDEQSPVELKEIVRGGRWIGPGQTISLGPSMELKTHKGFMRLVMTEGLADKLREFIADMAPQTTEAA